MQNVNWDSPYGALPSPSTYTAPTTSNIPPPPRRQSAPTSSPYGIVPPPRSLSAATPLLTGNPRQSLLSRASSFIPGRGMFGMTTAKITIVVMIVIIVLLAILVIHYSRCNWVRRLAGKEKMGAYEAVNGSAGMRENMYGGVQDYHAGCMPHYAFRNSHDYNLVDYKPPHLINMYPSQHNFVHDI